MIVNSICIDYKEIEKDPKIVKEIFKEAIDHKDCTILYGTHQYFIFVRDNSLANSDFDNHACGFLIYPNYESITIYIALDYGNTPNEYGTRELCKDLDLHTSLEDCISIAKSTINTCPICKQSIPYSQQYQYSYSGRCCIPCMDQIPQEKREWSPYGVEKAYRRYLESKKK